jgi:sigma-B regulation protein RsbU (phosphoserine phosphatase)
MIYGFIDTKAARVTLTQAGHPSPVYLPRGGKAVLLGTGGFPVGMLPEVDYETLTLDFQPGDRLALYSDGVTECMNQAHELFGETRLMRYVEEAGALPLNEMMQNLERYLHAWKGDNAFEDDVSVLAFEAI